MFGDDLLRLSPNTVCTEATMLPAKQTSTAPPLRPVAQRPQGPLTVTRNARLGIRHELQPACGDQAFNARSAVRFSQRMEMLGWVRTWPRSSGWP